MATMYLQYLESHLQSGSLHVHLPDGTRHTIGQQHPQVDWFLHHPRTLARIGRNPARMLGETYLRNEWDVGSGQLPQFLALLLRNIPETPEHPLIERWQRLCNRLRKPVCQVQDPAKFDEWLLSRFLDVDLHYQGGYFHDPDVSLEEAQRSHCRQLLKQLQLKPGQHILDLNAHWGGLALFLAEEGQVRVTAVVQNQKQLRYAQQRAHRRGLRQQVRFVLQEYHESSDRYDRITGLGVLEAMRPRQYALMLRQIKGMLANDGMALLQCVGRLGKPGPVNPWLKQYLFPHQYNPALSEISQGIEASGLVTRQVEILQQDYAHTLGAWQQRFQRNRNAIAHQMGERFCRLWEFHLAACEAGFHWRDLAVFSLQLTRPHSPTTTIGNGQATNQTASELIRSLQSGSLTGRSGIYHGTGPAR